MNLRYVLMTLRHLLSKAVEPRAVDVFLEELIGLCERVPGEREKRWQQVSYYVTTLSVFCDVTPKIESSPSFKLSRIIFSLVCLEYKFKVYT